MSVYRFHSLPNCDYSNIFVVKVFCNKYFPNKTPSSLKISYLLIFPDDEEKIFVYLDHIDFCFTQFCYQFFWKTLARSHFISDSSHPIVHEQSKCFFVQIFVKLSEIFKLCINWMIQYNLFKFSCGSYFHKKNNALHLVL